MNGSALANGLRGYTGGSTWNTSPTGDPGMQPGVTPYAPPSRFTAMRPQSTTPRQQRIQQMFQQRDPRAMQGLRSAISSLPPDYFTSMMRGR